MVAAARGDVLPSLAAAAVAAAAAWLFRLLVRGWSPSRSTPATAVARLAPFLSLAAASVVVALAENAATAAVLALTDGAVEWPVGLRWWRTLTGVFTLTATGQLVLAAMASSGVPRSGAVAGRRPLPARRVLEVVALLLLTLGLTAVTLQLFPDLPLAFLLFVPAAWVGVRFPPVAAASSAGAVGGATIAFTLAGRGLFSDLGSALVSVLVTQTFFVVLFTTTLVLSLLSTQLRTAEQRAQQRAQLLDRVMTASSSGVVLIDRDERVLLANRAGRQLLRLPRPPVTADQLGFGRLTRGDGTPLTPHEQPHRRALAGGTVTDEDLHLPDGTRTSVLRVTALPLGDEVLLTFADVTAELAHTTALQEFAGEVAHDLKNPLTVVEGWSEVLEGEFLEAGAVPSSSGLPMERRVRTAAARMSSLIDDLSSTGWRPTGSCCTSCSTTWSATR
ncbi:MASE1 domain-containing protein [Nocardioides daphniae]|uniref:histidine kinase n=1 Tax=Nocardioides daphniae TaxID=402297 RepID=A0A4V1CWL5_9ACTN|nr:histidine kinase dimerization/phospho-acceptor domain-containing protein [Nocardioides daphniae]QCC77687.1 PAS domain-containing protein [Nocardioides daphniae]GGD29444.1 hypothetical protein GCM10007231_31170 [Nocardioides daphniae]